MTIKEAIKDRHSVRSYKDEQIKGDVKEKLLSFIASVNEESLLNIEAVFEEQSAFSSRMAHYGKFSNVRNYIVIKGPKSRDLEEKSGYYGEKIVLYAQTLGLNTCFVALTYNKKSIKVNENEKLSLVIAIGYGETKGGPHKTKERKDVMKTDGDVPSWFLDGIDAALLAPTAMNQQKFMFILKGNKVEAKAGLGFYSKIDLGIAKYHFEIGAGKENFSWA